MPCGVLPASAERAKKAPPPCRISACPSPLAEPAPGPSALDTAPCAHMVHVNGFSGEYTGAMVPSVGASGASEAFFISTCNVVAMNVQTHAQRFFLGHSANVVAFAFSGASYWAARRSPQACCVCMLAHTPTCTCSDVGAKLYDTVRG